MAHLFPVAPAHIRLILTAVFAFFFLAGDTLVPQTLDGQPYLVMKIEDSQNLYVKAIDFEGVVFFVDKKSAKQNAKRFNPDIEEIFKAEKIFNHCLASATKDLNGIAVDKRSIKSPSEYYRQYLGYYNEKGQKVIYFNCFVKRSVATDNGWKKNELVVRDGGSGYFTLIINLESESCDLFMVNGLG